MFSSGTLVSSLAISLALVMTLSPTSAEGQSAEGSLGPSAKTDTSNDNTADIIVTAQRRPERLQDVPVSVTVVSGDSLRSRNLNDLSQVALAAPSLQSTADNGFAVRGVGTASFSSSIESSVAFAQDEVNLTNSGLVSEFYDVAQVEVLNGPQGLLFGRNASAGLLNITTTLPKLGVFGGTFDLEGDYRDTAAEHSGVIAKASINLPLGEKAAVRVSSLYDYQQPMLNFVGTLNPGRRADLYRRNYGVRAKLLFEPTDALSIYLIGENSREDGLFGTLTASYRSLAPGSANAGPLAATGVVVGPDSLDLGGNGGYARRLDRNGLQGKVSYQFPGGIEISNIAAWKKFTRKQDYDLDGTIINGVDSNFSDTKFSQYSNEFRVALPESGRLTGQGGLYYYHSTLDTNAHLFGNNYVPASQLSGFPFCVGVTAVPGARPPVCSASNSYFLGQDRTVHQTADSYAAFSQLTYKLSPQFEMFAGGRVTRDEIAIDLTQNQGQYFVKLGIPYSGQQSFKNTNFSWKVGGQYNLNRDVMLYATYGSGYKGPGFNDNAVTPTASLAVRPETNKNIEIGAKTSWLKRHLVVNVSAFQSRFSDYQAQSFDLTTTSFIIQNATKLRTRGAELTVIARPVGGLSINASATVLDSKYGDFPGAQCYPGQGLPGPTCATFNAKGGTPPLSPKFSSSIQGIYEFQTSGDFVPFIEANYYHRSPITFAINQAPGARYSDTDLLGGSVGFRQGNVRASIFCKNCTDQRVPISIGLEAGDTGSGRATYKQQFGINSFRTIGVSLGFDF